MSQGNTNAIEGHLSKRLDEAQSEHGQRQSPFLDRLPAEIRGAIYLEVWRTAGLSQHLFWHENKTNPINSKYCLWPCTTEFQVEDECEKELDVLWNQQRNRRGVIEDMLWYSRLQSHWYNHWRCEEHMLGAHEQAGLAVDRITDHRHSIPFNCPCRVNDILPRKPYLPMMLSCKKMQVEINDAPKTDEPGGERLTRRRYHECVTSIYESTTFVFVDEQTIHRFLGNSMESDAPANRPVPFLKSVRNLEVSLPITFPRAISTYPLSRELELNWVYGFHWLHLAEMKNCRQVKIWIDARYRTGGNPGGYYADVRGYTSITTLDADSLRSSFSTIGEGNPRCEVIITTPLGEAVGRECGFVDDIGHPRVRIWKRHKGDKFYPLPPGFNSVGRICGTPQRMPLASPGMRRFRNPARLIDRIVMP